MKRLLMVSLISAVFIFNHHSKDALAKEWSSPEALRAFGAPGDTVRDPAYTEVKKSSPAKSVKSKKQLKDAPAKNVIVEETIRYSNQNNGYDENEYRAAAARSEANRAREAALVQSRQDYADNKENNRARERKRAEEAQLLAKTDCTGGIPGECGPGRTCFFYANGSECMQNAEAERKGSERRQNMREQQREDNQAWRDRDIDRKLDRIDRKLGAGF
jgi:hypothetical protein